MLCDIETEVTADHGGRCTEINPRKTDPSQSDHNEMKGRSDMLSKRGFQHIYKNTRSSSSLRVHAASFITVDSRAPRNKNTMKREAKKRKKIHRLKSVDCSPGHSRDKISLEETPVFFSGTTNRTIPNSISHSLILSAIQDLQVIDTIEGARMELQNSDMVFVLIPRQEAICKIRNAKQTLDSLYALNNTKKKAEGRGMKRIPIPEDNGKYTTVGLKPNRGGSGIQECWPPKLTEQHRNRIRKLMKNCEEVAKSYVRSHELQGIKIARKIGCWSERERGTKQQIWGSLACGKNYYLNSHTDEDFFYSLTTTASALGITEDDRTYRMEAQVSNYFTFPEQGVAVALRPGDMLLFNPMYHHCLSSRTTSYQNDDVFCLSLYLKTAIVGKNDNALPITENEKLILKRNGISC